MGNEREIREQAFREAAHYMIDQLIRKNETAAAGRMVVSWICLIAKFATIVAAYLTGGVLTALGLYLQMVYFTHFCQGQREEEQILSGAMLLLLQFIFLGYTPFPVLCLIADVFDLGWVYFRREKIRCLKELAQIIQAKPKALNCLEVKEDTEEIELKLTEGITLIIHIGRPPALPEF